MAKMQAAKKPASQGGSKRAKTVRKASTKPALRPRSRETDPLAFARAEFKAGTAKALTGTGNTEFKKIFDETLGDFVGRGPKHKAAFETNDTFRKFLGREVRKIAKKADSYAQGQSIAGPDLHRAAVEVMVATNAFCKASVDETGKVKVANQGEVCATYLVNEAKKS